MNFFAILFYYFVFQIFAEGQKVDDQIVTVQTLTAKIRGKTKQIGENKFEIDVFFGIPYAKPPIGKLRFEA
jgi:hypothetical protein